MPYFQKISPGDKVRLTPLESFFEAYKRIYSSEYSFDFDGFNGFNERMRTGNDALDITGPMWIFLRLKTTSIGSLNCQICKDTTSEPNRSWNVTWRGSDAGLRQLVVFFWNTDGTLNSHYSTANVLDDGNGHSILWTYDGTNGANGSKLYRDGLLDTQLTAGSTGIRNYTGLNSYICIGSTSGATGGWFNQGIINSPAVGYGYLPDATDALNLHNGVITTADLGAEFIPDFDNSTYDGLNFNVPAFSGGASFTSEFMEAGDKVLYVP